MRALLASVILEQSHGCAIAEIDAALIDQIGIGAANRLVMEFALRDLEQRLQPNFLLIDAMTIDSGIPQFGIIDGDAISLSIAAASIVAKVHRDTIMTTLSPRWPDYGWDANKGYGVRKHVEAITRVGPCVHHRLSFRPMCDLTHVQHA
jgi:ribonuclease HII